MPEHVLDNLFEILALLIPIILIFIGIGEVHVRSLSNITVKGRHTYHYKSLYKGMYLVLSIGIIVIGLMMIYVGYIILKIPSNPYFLSPVIKVSLVVILLLVFLFNIAVVEVLKWNKHQALKGIVLEIDTVEEVINWEQDGVVTTFTPTEVVRISSFLSDHRKFPNLVVCIELVSGEQLWIGNEHDGYLTLMELLKHNPHSLTLQKFTFIPGVTDALIRPFNDIQRILYNGWFKLGLGVTVCLLFFIAIAQYRAAEQHIDSHFKTFEVQVIGASVQRKPRGSEAYMLSIVAGRYVQRLSVPRELFEEGKLKKKVTLYWDPLLNKFFTKGNLKEITILFYVSLGVLISLLLYVVYYWKKGQYIKPNAPELLVNNKAV